MKKIIKALSVSVCIIAVLLSISSCSDTDSNVDEDSVIISAFADLYENAKVLNEAIYGGGFPPEDTEESRAEYSVSHYCKVAEGCPYKNTDEFKNAINSTFSEEYAKSISEIMFSGLDYDSELISGFQPRYKDIDGVLAVDITYEGFTISTELDIDTAAVIEKKSKSCIIKLKTVGTDDEVNVKMLKENGAWLIDSATY